MMGELGLLFLVALLGGLCGGALAIWVELAAGRIIDRAQPPERITCTVCSAVFDGPEPSSCPKCGLPNTSTWPHSGAGGPSMN